MANHVTSFITFENLSDKAEDFLENMNEETLLQGLYSDYDNTYNWYIDNVGAKWLTFDDIDHLDGNHKNNCPDNLRSTCKPQHDSKSRESGDYTPQKYKEVA